MKSIRNKGLPYCGKNFAGKSVELVTEEER